MAVPEGLVLAVLTPFSPGGERVVPDWLAGHFAYVTEGGEVNGFYLFSPLGEAASLSLAEKKLLIDTAVAHRDRRSLIVGTEGTDLAGTLEIGRYALEKGADALVLAPPSTSAALSKKDLYGFYASALKSLPAEPRVLLYNGPGDRDRALTFEQVDDLLAGFADRLLGVVEATGEPGLARAYIERYPGLKMYAGHDGALGDAAYYGAVGAISAVANVFPAAPKAVLRAAATSDREEMEYAQEHLSRLWALIVSTANPVGVLKGLIPLFGDPGMTHTRLATPAPLGQLRQIEEQIYLILGMEDPLL
ncbi:MAG: dihydrodipicolinate synthase family protein [Chloroflexi bacterium]|nr:dihydrodipicolinate synthase family protein [Chloroflexota bacterium]